MRYRTNFSPAFPVLVLVVLLLLVAAGLHAEETTAPAANPSIDQYQEKIQAIQDKGGAMDPRLQEVLMDMGAAYQKRGDNDQAVAAYKRALFISRTHDGLENPGQIPIVEHLIDAETALAEAEELDKNYQYLYFLYQRNYGESDPRTIGVVERIARWRLHAYELDPEGTGLDHLIKADILYGKADKALRKAKEDSDTRRMALLYHRAVVNYHIAVAAEDYHISFHALRAALIDNGRPCDDVVERRARATLNEDAQLAGELAIRHILTITEKRRDADPQAYARALMFAGDWYLGFHRRWDAMRHYHKAWKLLAATGMSADQITQAFGEPRPIKPLTVPGDEPDEMPGHKYVDAVVDVRASGWPTNIRVNDVHPSDDKDLRRLGRRAIAAVRYRPRFENGEPVETQSVPIRYVFR